MPVDRSTLAATTRLFSSAVLQQMARKGRSPIFARLVREIGCDKFESAEYVSDVFDIAFRSISLPGNRNEYIYKSAIAKNILLGRHSLKTAAMLTEVRVGESKADVVVLNGTSTVYEVKSERDNLERLPEQLASYRQAFASVVVVTSDSHVEKVLDVSPTDVGVMALNRRDQLSTVRPATSRVERINPAVLFDVLRIPEAIQVLRNLNIELPSVPNTEIYAVAREVFTAQSPQSLHPECLKVLRSMRSQLGLKEFLGDLPKSLHAAAISIPIRKADRPRLVAAVQERFFKAEQWA